MCHEMSTLQSAGTDSAVNLWLASTNLDELTTERSVSYLICLYNFYMTLYFLFIYACIFGSQADSSSRWVDPLLNTYSDYEDSIYGKSCNFFNLDHHRLLLTNF